MLTTELPSCHLFDDTYVLVRCVHTLTKTLLFHSLGLRRYTLLKSRILKKKKWMMNSVCWLYNASYVGSVNIAAVYVCVCRSELEQLALEKQHLEETVKNLRARCSDMEEQCVQHGRMHQRMKDRWAHNTHNYTATHTVRAAEGKTSSDIFLGLFSLFIGLVKSPSRILSD